MRGVPPEIDQLMWAVAENPEPQAIAEFGERHPHLRAELMHRVNMVRSLRNEVRPSGPARQERPQFQHRQPVSAPDPKGIFLAGALTFAAIAAASYTAYAIFQPAPRPVEQRRETPSSTAEGDLVPKVVYVNPAPTPPPHEEQPPQGPTGAPVKPVEPAYLKPRDRVAFKDESLTTALALVTEGTGINLELGPGFVDQKISVDYRGKNTVEILHDMAAQYAFYISDEGGGTYLVLPVPDRETPSPARGPSKQNTTSTK